MKTKTIILSFLLVTLCVAQTKKKKRREPPTELYITNWGAYGLPDKVLIVSMKTILEELGSYKRGHYCPYGERFRDCEKRNMNEVVAKIIGDVLEYEKAEREKSDRNTKDLNEELKKSSLRTKSVKDLKNSIPVDLLTFIYLRKKHLIKYKKMKTKKIYKDTKNKKQCKVSYTSAKYKNIKVPKKYKKLITNMGPLSPFN